MLKYSILVFHREYNDFLKELQQFGVLHVAGKETELTEEIQQKYQQLNQIEKIILFLKNTEPAIIVNKNLNEPAKIIEDIERKQAELEKLIARREELKKQLLKAEPWGDFSQELIQKLKNENIYLTFYAVTKKHFTELEESGFPIVMISEKGNHVYFVLIHQDENKTELPGEEMKLPDEPYPELKRKLADTETQIDLIHQNSSIYAAFAVPLLEKLKAEIQNSLEFDTTLLKTSKQAEDKLMILEGWIPVTKKEMTDLFLTEKNALYFSRRATPQDDIPVLLKNNRFSRLFEPIGSMFSLPDYNELDLTVFFAPFFMLFFGFCLGDAGYGLLFIFGAGLYKLKAPAEFKPYLSLIQFLGLATIIFGAISGTFFGINLIEAKIPWMEKFKTIFLDPNKMFNLALILGALQIIFGLCIKAANQARQFGFSYALSTIGWLIILVGTVLNIGLTKAAFIPENKIIQYGIISAGGFFILFFSDPGVNVFVRVGKGIWDVYSTVTGIFGDLLSYIRLFALGLSSSILGFVINDIALQILGSSKILGPLFFIVFLLLGHTLNILISSLGSFVHPMRLTFVEFYKNAGFKGGGSEYRPFSKQNN